MMRKKPGERPPAATGAHERPEAMLERLLSAVTTMAMSSGSLRERLALVAVDVSVFHPDGVPELLRSRYVEFVAIVSSATVPPAALSHPSYPKSVPAYYLSPAKARRAAELLTSMLETVVFSLPDGAMTA